MRFLLKATIPVDVGNALIHDPDMNKKMDSIMADIRPEAVYFCLEHGQRTIYFVVSIEDTYEMPRIAEPLWLTFEADVEVIPAMSQEDFGKAAGFFEEMAKKY